MTEISPHLRLGNDSLSHQVKRDVLPIEKPVKRERSKRRLARRTELPRSSSRLKQTPLGHTTAEQKARVADKSCLICGDYLGRCHPAHVVPRGHPKMSEEAASDVRAVVPLCPIDHRLYDDGDVDLLALLEPEYRDSQEWAAGAVGLASAVRSITGERGCA